MEYGFLQEACRCVIEGCGNQQIHFKTTQLLFGVVPDVEGGRTRGGVLWMLGEKMRPLEVKLRFAQKGPCKRQKKSISRWTKIVQDMEGDAGRCGQICL